MPRAQWRRPKISCICVLAGFGVLISIRCQGASLKVPDTEYNYTVLDQELAGTLREFGANLNIKTIISSEVKGRVQGRIVEERPIDFLNRITSSFNMEWYYDGSVLYVTPVTENSTKLLLLDTISYTVLSHTLDTLQISDPRFPIRSTANKGLIMVSGPPRYVELVEQTLIGLVAEEQAQRQPKAVAKVRDVARTKPNTLTVYRGAGRDVVRDGVSDPANAFEGDFNRQPSNKADSLPSTQGQTPLDPSKIGESKVRAPRGDGPSS